MWKALYGKHATPVLSANPLRNFLAPQSLLSESKPLAIFEIEAREIVLAKMIEPVTGNLPYHQDRTDNLLGACIISNTIFGAPDVSYCITYSKAYSNHKTLYRPYKSHFKLQSKEGLFAGVSSGGAVSAALKIAREATWNFPQAWGSG